MISKEIWIHKKGYQFKLSENQDDTPDGQVRITQVTQEDPIILTVGALREILNGVPDSTPVRIGTSKHSPHLIAHRAHITSGKSLILIDTSVPEAKLISKNIPAQEYAKALLGEKIDMLLADNDFVGGIKYDIDSMLSDMEMFNVHQSCNYIRHYWIDTESEVYDPEFIEAHLDDIAKELNKRCGRENCRSWTVKIDKCLFEWEDIDKAQLACLINIAYTKETK